MTLHQQLWEQPAENPCAEADRWRVVGMVHAVGFGFTKLFTNGKRRNPLADGHPKGLYVLFTYPTTGFPFT